MQKIWIVVADAACARIFGADTPTAALSEIDDMLNPAGRLRNQDIDADDQGRSFDSAGEGRHAMSRRHDAHQQEALRFAQRVADHLKSALDERRFERLHVVAAPAFLGMLREALDDTVKATVASELDSDLVRHKLEDVRTHLPERL